MRNTNINVLVGLTLTSVVGGVGDDTLDFTTVDGRKFRMDHTQDCCESVRIEDICGDLADLLGSPIIRAEEVSSSEPPPGCSCSDSCTWTFYKIDTVCGGVTIRWLGESNGYYSERVDFEEIT